MTATLTMPDGSILGEKGSYARRDSLRLYYEIHGAGNPLVLMHGGLESIESLHPQAFALARRFRVLLPERRGHGRTPDTDGLLSYLQGAQDMIALMDALHVERADLAGYSDGAIVALFMAIHYPDRVGKVVSISGNYHFSGLSRRFVSQIRGLSLETFKRSEEETVRTYERVSPDGPGHLPVIFQKVKRMWFTQPRLTSRDLALVRSPVLVMAGDRDVISPLHTINLFRFLPRSQLCIIPGTTHALISEASDAVNSAILGFLA